MGRISGLVPSRFLTLLAHLVVVITLFWSRVRRGQDASARALLSPPLSSWSGWTQLSSVPSYLAPPPHLSLSFDISFCPTPQESNIQACLPLKFTPEEYEKQDVQ